MRCTPSFLPDRRIPIGTIYPTHIPRTHWNQFHCKRRFDNARQCGFSPRHPHARNRQAITFPAKPALQGAFASNRRTIPLGEMPINRKTATNRISSRFNKFERID
ncbi:hypothetical protein FU139_03945 [Burkholderia territorii]|nr:hypothetical protein FU139_03945 [Burkholderia territorii]